MTIEEVDNPAPEWVPNFPRIRRIDEIWNQVERVVCGAMFLAMSLLVFAAVITDIFGARRQWSDIAVLFGVVLLGTLTREVKAGETRPSLARSGMIAVAITAVITVVVYLYTTKYPGGFVWAQKLALVMMMWVALLGASAATYERAHLALEFGEKLWPARLLKYIKALANAVTSAFVVAMMWFSIDLVMNHHALQTHIEANLWLPRWVALLIMPYTFLAMTIRLLAQTVTVALDKQKPAEEQLPS